MNGEPTLVTIPAYNEERSIAGVVTDAVATGLPVIVVDDGSDDATTAIARNAGAVVLSLPVNLGVGGARRCAYRYAVEHGYRCLAECDADGQHPVHAIPSLISEAQSRDLDMLIGSRFTHGIARDVEPSWLRRLAMRSLADSASRATGARITDSTSGFRIIREPLLTALAEGLPAYYLGDTFEAIVSAGRSGYRIGETAIQMSPRLHGTSSASSLDAGRFVIRASVTGLLHLHEKLPARP